MMTYSEQRIYNLDYKSHDMRQAVHLLGLEMPDDILQNSPKSSLPPLSISRFFNELYYSDELNLNV